MNRLNFSDSRGDDYTFVQYFNHEITITKRSKNNDMFHQVTLSGAAIEKLQNFLNSLKENKEEDNVN